MSFITVDAEDVESGQVIEAIVEPTVRIGDEFKEDGRTYRRLPHAPALAVKDQTRFLAHNLPYLEDVQGTDRTRAPHYTKDGVAAFSTRRQRDEYASAHNDNPANGDGIVWDR